MRIPSYKSENCLPADTKQQYLDHYFPGDRKNLLVIALFSAVISIVFIGVDYAREGFSSEATVYKLITVVITIFSFCLIYFVKSRSVLGLTSILFPILILLDATVQEYQGLGQYPLFYSNYALSLMLFPFLYTGISIRQALASASVCLGIYTAFSLSHMSVNPFNAMQIPQLIYTFSIMWIIGVIIRDWRVTAFLRQEAINDQAAFLKREFLVLQGAHKVKNTLISVLSHDVKAPLDSLKGMLAVLKTDGIDPQEGKILFQQLETQVDQTSEFVVNTIEWTKNQMGGFKVNPVRIMLLDLVQNNANLFNEIMNRKQLRTTTSVPDDLAIFADREMANIALRNVLNNAIKFSPDRESIKIEASKINAQAELNVIDRGVGMTETEMTALFNWESDSLSAEKEKKGTQIGMALTSDFMRRNGGTIKVKQNDPGPGTTFTLVFPTA